MEGRRGKGRKGPLTTKNRVFFEGRLRGKGRGREPHLKPETPVVPSVKGPAFSVQVPECPVVFSFGRGGVRNRSWEVTTLE